MNSFYLKQLPHMRHRGGCFFVTLCTYDSIPVPPQIIPEHTGYLEYFEQYDRYHDAGNNGINIARPDLAQLITTALMEKNGALYEILYSCIMSNHIHLVLDTGIARYPMTLGSILKKIKARSSRVINIYLKSSGNFWQSTSYYHQIKNDTELNKIGNYIIENPVKAGKVTHWEDWPYTYVKYL
jgi:REP element-mobilizing transposase RayT